MSRVWKQKITSKEDKRLDELYNKNYEPTPQTGKLTLLFLLAHDDFLYDLSDNIYDFQAHKVKIENLNEMNIDDEHKVLLKIGLNLYYGNQETGLSPHEIVNKLSKKNLDTAVKTIMFYEIVKSNRTT